MKMENLVYGGLILILVLYLYKTFFAKNIQTNLVNIGGYGDDLYEHYENNVHASEELGVNEISAPVVQSENRTPSNCFPQKILTANELLPSDDSAAISDFNQSYPIGEGVQRGINYLSSGYHIGVNTVGQSLRNANRQIRSEPPNPQVAVSPWLNSTIGPDLERRPIDGGESCAKQE
tara:strand:+ start:2681 stop:3211 length:531 start_codon:yes stop_codon:yes gene_type:complete